MKDGYVPLINVGSISRFLENALGSYALDLVSPPTGMLPPEIPGNAGGRQSQLPVCTYYAAGAEEVQMNIGSVILVIWLVIGGFAAGQRGDYNGPVNCSSAATTAITILVGPFNYAGVDPHINCTVQGPSN
jgi:hypothetical protein